MQQPNDKRFPFDSEEHGDDDEPWIASVPNMVIPQPSIVENIIPGETPKTTQPNRPGPGSRLDQQINEIFTKLSINTDVAQPFRNPPGAEIDREIRELQSAVAELQEQQREQNRIRLRTTLETKSKVNTDERDENIQREDILDRPRSPEVPQIPHLPKSDRDRVHEAVEKAIAETQDTIKIAIGRGEKHLEDTLRMGQSAFLQGIHDLVEQLKGNISDSESSQTDQNNPTNGKDWV